MLDTLAPTVPVLCSLPHSEAGAHRGGDQEGGVCVPACVSEGALINQEKTDREPGPQWLISAEPAAAQLAAVSSR